MPETSWPSVIPLVGLRLGQRNHKELSSWDQYKTIYVFESISVATLFGFEHTHTHYMYIHTAYIHINLMLWWLYYVRWLSQTNPSAKCRPACPSVPHVVLSEASLRNDLHLFADGLRHEHLRIRAGARWAAHGWLKSKFDSTFHGSFG